MLVIIKSAPDTNDGMLGLTLAMEGRSDLILLQNGVYFAQQEGLGGFSGAVYVLDDDRKLRGIHDAELDKRATVIDYDKLTDLITSSEKVAGLF